MSLRERLAGGGGCAGTWSGRLDGTETREAEPPKYLLTDAENKPLSWVKVRYRVENIGGRLFNVFCDDCGAEWDGSWLKTADGVRPNVSGGWIHRVAIRDGEPTKWEEVVRCKCR